MGAPGALRWVDGARKDRGDPAGELFDDDLHFVGFVNATWAELIYFAPHTLTEVVAGNTFVFALYLAIIAKESVTVPASSFTRLTCFANGYRIRTNQLDEPVCIWLRRRTCAGDDAVSSD